jgi:hypothetical protein
LRAIAGRTHLQRFVEQRHILCVVTTANLARIRRENTNDIDKDVN